MPSPDTPEVLAMPAFTESPARGDEDLYLGVEERQRRLFFLTCMFGKSASDAARQLGVGVDVIEDDLRAIREDARRRMVEFDALAELGLALARYDAMTQTALFEAGAARSPFGKAALLAASLRATQLRIRLLLATGLIPRAATRVSVAVSVQPDLRRLSDAELWEHAKEIVRQHSRTNT